MYSLVAILTLISLGSGLKRFLKLFDYLNQNWFSGLAMTLTQFWLGFFLMKFFSEFGQSLEQIHQMIWLKSAVQNMITMKPRLIDHPRSSGLPVKSTWERFLEWKRVQTLNKIHMLTSM